MSYIGAKYMLTRLLTLFTDVKGRIHLPAKVIPKLTRGARREEFANLPRMNQVPFLFNLLSLHFKFNFQKIELIC